MIDGCRSKQLYILLYTWKFTFSLSQTHSFLSFSLSATCVKGGVYFKNALEKSGPSIKTNL